MGIAQRIEQTDAIRLLVGVDASLHHGQLYLEQALAQGTSERRIYLYVYTLIIEYILQDRGGRSIVLGMI